MRWCRFGTDFFACDCEKRKMYWMYIEFFGKKQAGKDVPKMRRRINQCFLSSKGGRRRGQKPRHRQNMVLMSLFIMSRNRLIMHGS